MCAHTYAGTAKSIYMDMRIDMHMDMCVGTGLHMRVMIDSWPAQCLTHVVGEHLAGSWQRRAKHAGVWVPPNP